MIAIGIILFVIGFSFTVYYGVKALYYFSIAFYIKMKIAEKDYKEYKRFEKSLAKDLENLLKKDDVTLD